MIRFVTACEMSLRSKRVRTGAIGDRKFEIDVLVAFAEKNRRLLHGEPQILVRHDRLRHARERRELIDHALDLTGLPLDRLRQRLEQLAILRHLLAELPAQTLGGKLYRRERVFDLVRDAPRDVRPSARALRLNEFRHVVEGHDRADVALAGLFVRDLYGERPLFVADLLLDLALPLALEAGFFGAARARRRIPERHPSKACRRLRRRRIRAGVRRNGSTSVM